jgi:hypothetical protein
VQGFVTLQTINPGDNIPPYIFTFLKNTPSTVTRGFVSHFLPGRGYKNEQGVPSS